MSGSLQVCTQERALIKAEGEVMPVLLMEPKWLFVSKVG